MRISIVLSICQELFEDQFLSNLVFKNKFDEIGGRNEKVRGKLKLRDNIGVKERFFMKVGVVESFRCF